jgi:uncharacterized protein YndB with AHSA1/START domain
MMQIRTEIIVNAPAPVVWSIITDFDSYPKWNTFTPRITLRNSEFKEGAEFDLDCQMTDRKLLKNEHEVVLTIDRRRYRLCMGTSRTKGRPGIKSFRWQICRPVDDRSTRFVNYEEFHGPFAPLVYFLYTKKLSAAFRKYCEGLKMYVEKIACSSK